MQNEKINCCKYAKKCGGCQLTNMTYERQLQYKQATAVRLLGKLAHVENIIGMENPYHYRNKVQAAFGTTRNGRIVSGVYQSSTHRIVDVNSCLTEDVTADKIIVTIKKMLPDFRILPYNEYTKKGLLRHVLVKRSFTTNQIMVVLVTASPIFPIKKKFVKALLEKHPEISTVILNINPMRTSMLLGSREEVLFGSGYIEDMLCGCKFRISAKSFYQINHEQTEKLYAKALEYADLDAGKTVFDAYCGTGTIGIIASKNAKAAIGVEINTDAVRDAKYNARLNGAKNIQFVCADAGNFMVELAEEKQKVDVLFMDPPRAGADEKFLSSAVKMSPEKIIYISCNPETQKRDLIFLSKNGYKPRKIQPVDMFPHTSHVETVVLLSRASN